MKKGKPKLAISFAERKGFEPLERKAFNGFRDRPDRPLRHLSLTAFQAGSSIMEVTFATLRRQRDSNPRSLSA